MKSHSNRFLGRDYHIPTEIQTHVASGASKGLYPAIMMNSMIPNALATPQPHTNFLPRQIDFYICNIYIYNNHMDRLISSLPARRVWVKNTQTPQGCPSLMHRGHVPTNLLHDYDPPFFRRAGSKQWPKLQRKA